MLKNKKATLSVIILLIAFSLVRAMAQQAKLVLPFTHEGKISSMAFSPSGRYLLSGDSDGVLKTWDMTTGTQIATRTIHNWDINAIHFISEKEYITTSRENIFKKWTLGKDQPLVEFGSENDLYIVITMQKSQR